ncbi:MAG: hypothetical protein WCS43_08605 [Verrucomicrobiota bacterium]
MKKIIVTLVSLMALSGAASAESAPGSSPGSPGPAAGGAPSTPEGNQEKPASVIQANVVAKKREYLLTQALKDGKAAIEEALTKKKQPSVNPPEVDLELELKNGGDKPVTMIWGGDQSRITLSLKGPGAINGSWPMMMTMDFQMGVEIKLAPGDIHRVPIKSLGYGPRKIVSGGCWWTTPGDYTLTVGGNFSRDNESVPFSAPPVKLKVSETKHSES